MLHFGRRQGWEAEQAAGLGWPPVAVWRISALTIPYLPLHVITLMKFQLLLSLTLSQVALELFSWAQSQKKPQRQKKITSSQIQTLNAAAAPEESVVQSLKSGGYSIDIELSTLNSFSSSLWRRNTVHGQLLIRARRLLVSSERETLGGCALICLSRAGTDQSACVPDLADCFFFLVVPTYKQPSA